MIKGLNISDFNENTKITVNERKDIAIIGISIKMAGIEDEHSMWKMLTEERDNIHPLSEERIHQVKKSCEKDFFGPNMNKIPVGGYLDSIDEFDYESFHILPREAELMNPAHRLLLMSVRDLFENAGYTDEQMEGSNTGVYIGMMADAGIDKYKEVIFRKSDESYMQFATVGNLASISAGRISYNWNLTGPSMVIDTACSSSLVALHTSCMALRNRECKMAVVSGINVDILPGLHNVQVGFESKSNITRPFSNDADGTAVGEGIVSLLVKPLEDAENDKDHIYCIIKGSAVNQDGYSLGITAPNPEAQKNVIIKAWNDAGINPSDISYLEAHGTGTILGDPIEVEGIYGAFSQTDKKDHSCAIGSVKSNIGHLYGAAGLAGVVKCALALRHKKIPATLNFTEINDKINLKNECLYVVEHSMDWDEECRICGVSSFGFSGTNCHLILEEYMEPARNEQGTFPFMISADTEEKLHKLMDNYYCYIKEHEEYSYQDICFTTCVGRKHEKYRKAAMVSNKKEILENLQRWQAGGNEVLDAEEDEITSYLSGKNIFWKNKFYGKKVHRIYLPGGNYEKKKCWIGNIDEAICEEAMDENAGVESYSVIKQEIIIIVKKVLGIEQIDEEREIMEYGESSLLLTEIYAKISEKFPNVITLPQLFVYSSIEKISHYIDEKVNGKVVIQENEGEQTDLDTKLEMLFDNFEKGNESLEDILQKLESY